MLLWNFFRSPDSIADHDESPNSFDEAQLQHRSASLGFSFKREPLHQQLPPASQQSADHHMEDSEERIDVNSVDKNDGNDLEHNLVIDEQGHRSPQVQRMTPPESPRPPVNGFGRSSSEEKGEGHGKKNGAPRSHTITPLKRCRSWSYANQGRKWDLCHRMKIAFCLGKYTKLSIYWIIYLNKCLAR